MLQRDSFVPGDRCAAGVDQGYPSGDPIRTVGDYRDRRGALEVPVDVVASLMVVDGVAQRTGRAVSDRPDDLVHSGPTRRDERFLVDSESQRQPVGAEAGVLADAAVVVDR